MLNMDKTIVIHPSKARLLLECAHSLLDSDGVQTTSTPAKVGSAFADAIRRYRQGEQVNIDHVAELYGVFGDDRDQLTMYFRMGVSAWIKRLSNYFVDPIFETPIRIIMTNGVEFHGRPDIYEVRDDTAFIIDDKTGWGGTDDSSHIQPKLYGGMLCEINPVIQKVVTGIVHYPSYTEDIKEWNRAECIELFNNCIHQIIQVDPPYVTGDHCKWCTANLICKAYQSNLNFALKLIAGEIEPGSFGNPEILRTLTENIQQLSNAIETIKGMITLRVKDAGGEIVLDNGKKLKLMQIERASINTKKAWQFVQKRFGDNVVKAITISLLKLQDLEAEAADKGGKGKAKDALKDWMKEAGMLTFSFSEFYKTI